MARAWVLGSSDPHRMCHVQVNSGSLVAPLTAAPLQPSPDSQYLVFEYVERNLLEILEEHPGGLEQEQVGMLTHSCRHLAGAGDAMQSGAVAGAPARPLARCHWGNVHPEHTGLASQV